MQAHELRERAQHVRKQGYAAPTAAEERNALHEAADLERKAAELEKTDEQRQVEAIRADLQRATVRAERAEKRLEHRDWLLSQIIGRPVAGMSSVAIGAAVHSVLGDLRTTA